jgi:hypothetical protein
MRAIIAAARAANAHDRRGVPLVPVPHGGAAVPAFWPAGFDRGDLFDLPVAAIDALLAGYGLPAGAAGGNVPARRNALARHLGTSQA